MRIKAGSTDVTTYFKLIDPSTGAPETSLTITDLDLSYVRDAAAAVKADATALGSVTAAHTDNAAIEVDSTNCPGLYRVDWPDLAFASGVDYVQLCVNGAAIDPTYIEVELVVNTEEDVYTRIGAPAGASVSADIADVPTVSEFNARTLLAASYFDSSTDTVTLAAATHTGAVIPTVSTLTGHTAQTGDSFARLGAPAGASVSADIAAVKAETATIVVDTNELQTDWANGGRLDLILDARASQASVDTIDTNVDSVLVDTAEIGTAGAGLTAVPWNASWDTEVQSECTDALNAYDPPTRTEATADKDEILAQVPDVYHADIEFTSDGINTQDEYTVTWFKNGIRITSGITLPTIQVIRRSNGADLVASSAMTQIGSTGSYKYDEPTNRVTAGEAVVVVVAATIDSGSRAYANVVSRDSSS